MKKSQFHHILTITIETPGNHNQRTNTTSKQHYLICHSKNNSIYNKASLQFHILTDIYKSAYNFQLKLTLPRSSLPLPPSHYPHPHFFFKQKIATEKKAF